MTPRLLLRVPTKQEVRQRIAALRSRYPKLDQEGGETEWLWWRLQLSAATAMRRTSWLRQLSRVDLPGVER